MKIKKFIAVSALESAGIDPRSLGLHKVTGVDALGYTHTMWVQINPADRGLEVELARTRLLIGHRPFVAIATEDMWINLHEQRPDKLLGDASILPCGTGWAVYLDRKETVFSAFDTHEDRIEKAVRAAQTLTQMCDRLHALRESRIAHPVRAARIRAEIAAHAAASADRRAEGRRKAKEVADSRVITKALAWYAAQRDYFQDSYLTHDEYAKRDAACPRGIRGMLLATCPHFGWDHDTWFRLRYEARGRFVHELTWGCNGEFQFTAPTDRVAMATPHGAEALAALLNRGAEKCGIAK